MKKQGGIGGLVFCRRAEGKSGIQNGRLFKTFHASDAGRKITQAVIGRSVVGQDDGVCPMHPDIVIQPILDPLQPVVQGNRVKPVQAGEIRHKRAANVHLARKIRMLNVENLPPGMVQRQDRAA